MRLPVPFQALQPVPFERYPHDNHKQLSINAVAKAIGERYEGVYRLEHGGGTSTVLVKYLLFIKQHDPKFDLEARIKEIMGDKYPKY